MSQPLQELTRVVNNIVAKLSREMYIHFTVLNVSFPLTYSGEINLRVHCDGLYLAGLTKKFSVAMWAVLEALIFRSGRIVFHWTVSGREDSVLRHI